MHYRPPPPPRRMWMALALGCAALALCCPACGDGRPEVYPVSGQVFVGTQPAARATVTFHPVADTPEKYRPTGQVDEQGNFRLTTFAEGDGAPAGEYRVTVVWFLAKRASATEDPIPVNQLPARYGNPETSQLKATVTKGPNTLEAFRLVK